MQAFIYMYKDTRDAHGYYPEYPTIFVPSLKLTFNNKFDIWETDELTIKPSNPSSFNPKYFHIPSIKKEAEEAKIREDKEVAHMRATVREIRIPEDVGPFLIKLLQIKKEKKNMIKFLQEKDLFH